MEPAELAPLQKMFEAKLDRVAELEVALRDVVEAWRSGDVHGGHEAIGRAEDLLKSKPR